MALPTGRVIRRARVKEVPMTDLVIQKIEALAEAQGIKPLKDHYRDGTYDDWIAGVDSDSESKDSDNSEDEAPPILRATIVTVRVSLNLPNPMTKTKTWTTLTDRKWKTCLRSRADLWKREQSNPINGEVREAEVEAGPMA
jgi:hypothetical protein